jgi:dTDP-4-dehydrorhamnose 3,5-epimerase
MEKATVIYNPVFKDDRGTFAPLPLKFIDGMTPILNKTWVQSSVIYHPKILTFSGMYYQNEPYGQAKLLKVIKGRIISFAFDMRQLSDEYAICRSDKINENYEVLVPRGYAHGFITLEENTIVQYLVDNVYKEEADSVILWKSIPKIIETLKMCLPNIVIDDIIVSDKDKKAQTMVDWLNRYIINKDNENK